MNSVVEKSEFMARLMFLQRMVRSSLLLLWSVLMGCLAHMMDTAVDAECSLEPMLDFLFCLITRSVGY